MTNPNALEEPLGNTRAVRTLEAELLAAVGGDEKGQITARYRGLDGLGGATLQATGREFGMSAERVRQIVNVVARQVNASGPATPLLDLAIALLACHVPGRADDLERRLQTQGISKIRFRLEGIIWATQLLGRPTSFSLIKTGKLRLIHNGPPKAPATIVKIGRRTIEHHGVATIADICARLPEKVRHGGEQFVGDVLSGEEDFQWLDQKAGCFWLSGVQRNRVVTRIRKILSVANPIDFPALYAGIARDYRMKGTLIPPAALMELCRRIPGMLVDGQSIAVEPAIAPGAVLGEAEKSILDLLISNGGPMVGTRIAAACREQGMNRSSVYGLLEHSPVIASYAPGVFGPVGLQVQPETLERLLHPLGRCGQARSSAG